MIQRLRHRIIFISVGSLAIILVVAILAINLGQQVNTTHRADSLIRLIYENNNEFPDQFDHPEFSPETAYESRYFVVHYDKSGVVYLINVNHVAAVDSERALSMTSEILQRNTTSGYDGTYRFGVFPNDSGTSVIVLDCYSQIQASHKLLLVTILVSLALESAVLLIMLATSQRMVRPFVENYENQNRFITDAGHELKTPLTIISANTDVLEMTSGANEWTESIRDQVSRMNTLVRNLIELSRINEVPAEDAVREFDMSEVLAQSINSFQVLADQKGLSLRGDIAPGLLFTGTPDSIIRLIGILLDNALKYADPNSEILISLSGQKKHKVITVSNDCSTLDPEVIPKLFDRFYRADSSRARSSGGYGIGLSIAEAIVTRYKGRIFAEYTAPRLTFTVEL